MSVSRDEIIRELKVVLRPEQFKDYCPNGLQVEGKDQVQTIVSGVTACQALIDTKPLQASNARGFKVY